MIGRTKSQLGQPRPLLLLVEDDANDILLFRRAFKKIDPDADLETAENAEKAQASLLNHAKNLAKEGQSLPALVLLDLKLSGKSGLDLLEWIRQQATLLFVVVVVFTSSREIEDVVRAYELGVNSYIVKPTGFESLLETVRLIINYWLGLNERPVPRKRLAGLPSDK